MQMLCLPVRGSAGHRLLVAQPWGEELLALLGGAKCQGEEGSADRCRTLFYLVGSKLHVDVPRDHTSVLICGDSARASGTGSPPWVSAGSAGNVQMKEVTYLT